MSAARIQRRAETGQAVQDVHRRVGKYEILREVGRGGMAVVYVARQTDLDRVVALKELAAFHGSDPAFAQRFLHESRIAASLAHRNIVTVHEYFEHDGTPFIAMEYLERGSLRPLIGRLSLAQIAVVLDGMLAGLAHAESRAVVHRDLKPENLMVAAEDGVKIADFGIAKAANQAASQRPLTRTGMTVGTPAYMAPEQARGRETGPWTDLYSAGVIAYELLLGRLPFAAGDTPALLYKHVHEPIPPPRSVDPTLSEPLVEWLAHLLETEPEARPSSAAAARESLEEIVLAVLGPRWRRDGHLADLPEATPAAPDIVAVPMPEAPSVEAPEEADAPSVPDDFRTYNRRPRPVPARPAPMPPSQRRAHVETPAPPVPAPDLPPPEPPLQPTVQPALTPRMPSFEWPFVERPRRRGLRLLGGASLFTAAGVAGVLVALAPWERPAPAPERTTVPTGTITTTTKPKPPKPSKPPILRSVTFHRRSADRTVTVALWFAGGKVDWRNVRARDLRIADGDADSVGLFQMRMSIWNRGSYVGYPDRPALQLRWFVDRALAVRAERLEEGLPDPTGDPAAWGEWIADVERPAEQYRGRYQERLAEARQLLGLPG